MVKHHMVHLVKTEGAKTKECGRAAGSKPLG